MPDDPIDEIDRLHAEANLFSAWAKREEGCCGMHGTVYSVSPQFTDRGNMRGIDASLIVALVNAWPAIRDRLKAAERRAKAFEAIRELFDRFDTRFASCRDQVILTDDLIERCRDAIRCANGGETGAEFQS